jgi:hypothetical protein
MKRSASRLRSHARAVRVLDTCNASGDAQSDSDFRTDRPDADKIRAPSAATRASDAGKRRARNLACDLWKHRSSNASRRKATCAAARRFMRRRISPRSQSVRAHVVVRRASPRPARFVRARDGTVTLIGDAASERANAPRQRAVAGVRPGGRRCDPEAADHRRLPGRDPGGLCPASSVSHRPPPVRARKGGLRLSAGRPARGPSPRGPRRASSSPRRCGSGSGE